MFEMKILREFLLCKDLAILLLHRTTFCCDVLNEWNVICFMFTMKKIDFLKISSFLNVVESVLLTRRFHVRVSIWYYIMSNIEKDSVATFWT